MEDHNQPKEIYTLGIWTIKPGKENDFIKEWTSFAHWMSKHLSGARKGHLLQDEKNPLRFISFGPWENEDEMQKWRDSKEFKEFIAKVIELCDDFQPNTLKVVSASQ